MTVSLSTIGGLLFVVCLWSLGVGVVALVGLASHVGPSILVVLVCVSLILSPWGAHAINSSHPCQDRRRNQAMRNAPPGRIGYPSQSTRSNRYSKPIPPTHNFHTMQPGRDFG